VWPPKSGSGVPFITVPALAPRSRSKIARVGSGHRVHGVEGEAQSAGELAPERVEVEQSAHLQDVVGHRVDHLDLQRADACPGRRRARRPWCRDGAGT
jgi:hypothetical protein